MNANAPDFFTDIEAAVEARQVRNFPLKPRHIKKRNKARAKWRAKSEARK